MFTLSRTNVNLEQFMLYMFFTAQEGGGGADMRIFEYPPRKWPKTHTQKLFLSILSNGKIVYYQDVPQLPVPLNTLHTIHLNAKSHNLL